MKKILIIVLMLFLCSCSKQTIQKYYNIYSLNGPTSMGIVKLIDEGKYQSYRFNDASEITTKMLKGEVDIALIPCNLASIIFNQLKENDFNYKVVNINTENVLYFISSEANFNSINDLEGKTIYTTGLGSTPEFTLRYILQVNGLENTKIEFLANANEIASYLASGKAKFAYLPVPFIFSAMANNENLHLLDYQLNDIVTAVTVVRSDLLDEKFISELNKEFAKSLNYVINNQNESAELMVKHNIIAKKEIALQAIPYGSLVNINNNEMKNEIKKYLNMLYQFNPKSIGGNLPDEDFYYIY